MIDQRNIYTYIPACRRVFLYISDTSIFASAIERKTCLSCTRTRFIPSYSGVQSSPIPEFIAFRDRADGWSSTWNRLLKDSCWKDGFFRVSQERSMNIRGIDICFGEAIDSMLARRKNKWSALKLPCNFRFHFWTTRISLLERIRWRDLFQLVTNISCEFIYGYVWYTIKDI